MEEMRNAYRFYTKTLKGKGPLKRPRLNCSYNIKLDLVASVV
jgi:hypothetical protein